MYIISWHSPQKQNCFEQINGFVDFIDGESVFLLVDPCFSNIQLTNWRKNCIIFIHIKFVTSFICFVRAVSLCKIWFLLIRSILCFTWCSWFSWVVYEKGVVNGNFWNWNMSIVGVGFVLTILYMTWENKLKWLTISSLKSRIFFSYNWHNFIFMHWYNI